MKQLIQICLCTFLLCNNTYGKIFSTNITLQQLQKPLATLVSTNGVKASNKIHDTNAILKLVPHAIRLKKGNFFKLNIPVGYKINIAAEGLKRLRFLAKSPDGKLFATDMYDRNDNHKGKILLFDKWNEKEKKFDSIITFLDKLHNPNQVAFYKGYIYVAETDKLSRYAYKMGDVKPSSIAQVIAQFPAYGLGYKYGGWHLTRSLAFDNDKLYVSIGSSCNACIEKEEIRACIVEMDPDGGNKKIFAKGLRNAVGIKWINHQLWVTNMGRDLLGPDRPEDLLQIIERAGFYGWPFYYQYQQKIYADKSFIDSAKDSYVKKPPLAWGGFKAHSAPLGFEYMENFSDKALKNKLLVCLHGSTSVWRQRGNSIVMALGGNKYTAVVDGFLTGKREKDRHGRPCDILMHSQHSFFFTDDLNGVLYFVWK